VKAPDGKFPIGRPLLWVKDGSLSKVDAKSISSVSFNAEMSRALHTDYWATELLITGDGLSPITNHFSLLTDSVSEPVKQRHFRWQYLPSSVGEIEELGAIDLRKLLGTT
jgi:hypothetical protein